mmetsp:Transcript_16833/g.43321  ORF Transcript_16833/g.43321 Transcript_16833/m.43321 type:complete len:88 (-) Transcript_16833:43-306(-)
MIAGLGVGVPRRYHVRVKMWMSLRVEREGMVWRMKRVVRAVQVVESMMELQVLQVERKKELVRPLPYFSGTSRRPRLPIPAPLEVVP